jgi:hypothetical protein
VHIEVVQGIAEVDVFSSHEQDRLKVAVFLKNHVYGRTRRITFTQLTQRQWLQYPLPYSRVAVSRDIPTPDWLAECEADLQQEADAVIAALADELDDESDEADE